MKLTEQINRKYGRHLVATEKYNQFSSLDIYVDKRHDMPQRKLIIFWYGGSWIKGHKEMYRFAADFFARISGAVVLVPDYQKHPDVVMPRFIAEAWEVVAWAKANASTYGATIDGYSAIGHSAGGHTATMVGVGAGKPDGLPLPKKCVGLAGPYATVTDGFAPVFAKERTSGTGFPVEIVQCLTQPSSVNFLFMHGRFDRIVWPSQQRDFVTALKNNGAKVTYTRPWTGHIGLILACGSPLGAWTRAGKILRKHLC